MQKFNEQDKPFRSGSSGAKYLVNGPYWDGGVAVFKPGQALGEHWHEEVEETFYFLEGSPRMIIDGKEHRVRPGDVFILSKGEKHDIVNDTKGDIKFFFIKAPFKPQDKKTGANK